MRNSILKTYLKRILRSEAFVSVIIVFVLAIGIIGTSYALYMDVDTDTDYQLVEVGDLSVGFDNGESTFQLNYLTPTDDDIATGKVDSVISKEISENNLFSFYIYNNGTYTANYNIKLVPQSGSISGEYLRYQICKDNRENCKDIKSLSEATDNIIFTDELNPNSEDIYNKGGGSAYYFLRVWVKSDYTPSENDKVILKVEIDAKNASGYLDNDNTLVGKLLNDDRVKINNTVPKFDGIADYVETGNKNSGELGLFKAPDDYGISYYYRGAQSYNYVNFAGFTWRVVRINGDGSIRLILDGTLDKVSKDGIAVYTNTKLAALDSDGLVSFKSSPYNDNAYVGYMFGTAKSSDYGETHKNLNDSTVKKYVDAFYEEYLLDYQDEYLADTLFCGDKSRATDYTTLGYGNGETQKTLYGAYERLYKDGVTSTPSLECVSRDIISDKELTEELLAYSRYTSKLDMNTNTKKGVLVNNDLKYPIAFLSADELVMAGAFKEIANNKFYLFDSSAYNVPIQNPYWYTMSPAYYSGTLVYVFNSHVESKSLVTANEVSHQRAVRPVINLKSDVLWASGDGTSGTPYEIK